MMILQVKVVVCCEEVDGIVGLELVLVDGVFLLGFIVGVYIDVYLLGGLLCQYLLCNVLYEQYCYQIGVLCDVNLCGGLVVVYEVLKVGDLFIIGVLCNQFVLVLVQYSLLLVGGIGVMFILCMVEVLVVFGVFFEMYYCVCLFLCQVFCECIVGLGFVDCVVYYYDDGDVVQKFDLEVLLLQFDLVIYFYVCGFVGFIVYVVEMVWVCGWLELQVYFEYFGVVLVMVDGNGVFDVKLVSSGQVYIIFVDCMVIQVLCEYGVDVLVFCEQGICGICFMCVLEGELDYCDQYLIDEERVVNDQFMFCCLWVCSLLLVLDL